MASAGPALDDLQMKYEFSKYFTMSAEASFASLDGQSELSKKIKSGFGILGVVVTFFAGKTGGAVAFSPKYAIRPFDEIRQLRNKMTAIATVAPTASNDFEIMFRKLFVTTSVQVYHTYKTHLKDVYLFTGKGAQLKKDHLQAIQILATYAGGCCFESFLGDATADVTGTLVKALRDEAFTRKVKSLWKLWTTDALRIIPQSANPKKRPTKVTTYEFFQELPLVSVHYSDFVIRDEFSHETSMAPCNEAEEVYKELMNDRSYIKNDAIWVKMQDIQIAIGDVATDVKDTLKKTVSLDKKVDVVVETLEGIKQAVGCPSKATNTILLVKEPCSTFTGRKEILNEIYNALQTERNYKNTLSLVVVTGAGGMGKTQTARKYALKQSQVVYSVIICINAETLDALRDSFIEAEVATTKGNLKDLKDYPTEDKVASLANTVYIQLSNDYKQEKVLMIFDNAIQMNTTSSGLGINKFLPNQEYGAHFHVLVTSQNQDWTKPHTLIILDKLDDIDAIALLKYSFRQNLTDEVMRPVLETELQNLQKILDGYPLGIAIAAADILDGLGQDTILQDDLITKIQNYSTRFEASNEPLKFESESHESDYGKMMSKVLNLAISRIRKKQAAGNVPEKAIQLLHMMSYLPPDGINERDCYALFYSQHWHSFSENNDEVEKQRKELNECFRILKNMSLITLEEKVDDFYGRSIQLHRLVQKITREIFKPNVSHLNCWFKPLRFVSVSSFNNATHVLQNICSTLENNIPLVALASAYSVVVSHNYEGLTIGTNERIKKLLRETEQDSDTKHALATELQTQDSCPDTLKQDLQKFLYHIVCLEKDHLTSNVRNSNEGHVTQVVEVMKTHVDDLWVQYIGIQAFDSLRRHERPFTQDEVKRVLDWIDLFFDTRHRQNTNYMTQMHDDALSCSLKFIASSDENEDFLRNAEAYIKLTNDTKHSMDDKIDCYDLFIDKVGRLSKDFRRLSLQGDDVTRMSNVFLAAVDIFARRLARLDQDNDSDNFWRICNTIINISDSAELAKMFWSSGSFMEAFLRCCFSFVKELEKIDSFSDQLNIVISAGTLIALFEKASDEDINSYVSTHYQIETVLPSVLHRLERLYHEDKDKFSYLLRYVSYRLPLNRFKRFLRKDGEKDVWFVKVALAVVAPGKFFSEDPDFRSQALQYVLSKEEFDSEDDSEDENDDAFNDEEYSASNKVSDEKEN